jgi:O-antigen/teichoic acid export membrane protein
MAITTSVLGPLTQVLIRNIVIDKVSLDASGLSEAMTRISNLYLTIFSTTLTIYLIPKIAEIKDRKDHKYEIVKIIKIIIPITCCGALFIYYSRNYIIKLLFSIDFNDMEILFGWQVIGDIFRSISWIFSFYLLSQSSTMKFITAETGTSIFYVVVSFLMVSFYGLVGSAMAYTLTNIFYLSILLYLTLPMMRNNKSGI